MSEYAITIDDEPEQSDITFLQHQLSFNVAQTDQEGRLLAVWLNDHQGEILGGTYVWTAFGWLRIDLLWLRADVRRSGWGTRLLFATEAEAVKRGCRFAELEDVAGFHKWHFLKKDLT